VTGNAPLAIDLYCGLGGWTEGLLAEGYDVIGFDIENHQYGDAKYPAQLVLQDVLTLHGRQFKDAALIVASPPCQEFSYMAMPWSKAKAKRAAILADPAERKRLTALFDACFRIQREAIEAAGHFIPLVVENVRGANEWVGRSRWNFGSFHLWGDVPALMPMVKARAKRPGHSMNKGAPQWGPHHNTAQVLDEGLKVSGFRFDGRGKSFQIASVEHTGFKSQGLNWSDQSKRCQDFTRVAGQQRALYEEGVKFSQSGAAWFDGKPRDKMLGDKGPAAFGSKSNSRKAASAAIAKIPLLLARYIAAIWKPREL
jgi:hypothetical protein